MGWGSAIGAIAGGLLSSKSNKDSNDANAEQAALNYQQQKEFAQHGIRWRVKDAKAAGLHPLAALGAQTTSFSPMAIGNTPDPIGGYISDMGQNIDRAFDQTRSKAERDAELQRNEQHRRETLERQKTIDKLNVERHRADLEHLQLQNQLLASQIGRYKSAQLGPGMPANAGQSPAVGKPSGVAPAGVATTKAAELISRDAKIPSLEAGGETPGFKQFRVGGPNLGAVVELPNEPLSQAMESAGQMIGIPTYLSHTLLRGMDQAFFGDRSNLPKLPDSHYWRFNPITRKFTATKKSSSRGVKDIPNWR